MAMIPDWWRPAGAAAMKPHSMIAERERAEEKLRKSEAYLAEAQRLSHTGSFGWAVSSGKVFWSDETFRILQYEPTTKPSVDLVLQRTHPEDRNLVKETIERASQDGKDFDFEHRLLMPNGSIKHVRVVGHAERDQSNELEFVGAVIDVTAAKEAAELSRQNEKELRTTIETIPAFVSSTEPDGSLDIVSPNLLDYAGLSKEEWLDKGWRNTTHPEDLDRVVNKWRMALADGERFEDEVRLRRADGKYRWFLVRTGPLRDDKGNIVKWYSTAFDIEERKQAEEKLRRSEAYLSEAQRLSHTGNFAWDLSSGKTPWSKETFMASPEFLRIFGFDPDKENPTVEMFRERIHPKDRLSLMEIVDKARRERASYDIDFRIVLPDGSIKHLHSASHPVYDDSGNLVEYFGTTMDVTERKRAEEELRASEQVARGQAEALAQSLDVLTTAPEPEKFIGQLLNTIGRLLNAQSVALWVFDESTDSFVWRLMADGGKPVPSDPEHPFVKDPLVWKQNPAIQEMLFTGGPIVCEDVQIDPRVTVELRDYFKKIGTKRFLGVPISIGGQVRGFIGVRHTDQASYRREEIELTQALAHQVMLALQLNELAEQNRRAAILEERNRMARDIHDTLAQGFTGVIMQLEAAEKAIERSRPKLVDEYLQRAGKLARQSLSEARRSVHALRPEALKESSFWDALKEMVKSITVGTALHPSFKAQGKVDQLPPVWQENLLHIGQEALANTIKYARARKFGTRLIYDPKELRLEFSDDGDGFKPQDRHGGSGLAGMRERVEQMGGELKITSVRGKGTKISVVLPSNGKSML
jgi:PAS domain S-box-containing protein